MDELTATTPAPMSAPADQPRPRLRHGQGFAGGRLWRFPALPSTNAWALAHPDALRHGDIVITYDQSSGRGRLDRVWQAAPGRGLTATLIARDIAPVVAPRLGQLAALAVVTAVHRLTGLVATVKWPNDVLVEGRKLAGILVEAAGDPPLYAVGIGLNVNQTRRDFASAGLTDTAVSLRLLTRRRGARLAALRAVATAFDATLDRLARAGEAWIAEVWAAHDALADARVRVQGAGDDTTEGRYLGMAADGRLRLLTDDGHEALFWSGDVTRVRAVTVTTEGTA